MNETYYNSYDQEEPEMPQRWLVLLAVTVAVAMFLLSVLTGCKTQYVPVEKTVTEVRYRDLMHYDSIYQRDSIYLEKKGDTVIWHKETRDFRVLFVNRTDTVYKDKQVEVEVVKEVEKPLKWHTQMFAWIGKAALGLLALYGAYRYIKRKRKAA